MDRPDSNVVRVEQEGDIAFIVIDNGPINAASIGVRQGIVDAVGRIATDGAVKAAVLIGAGKSFIAGSDLREFSAPLADPQMPAVIAALENCPKPIVAALHGAALGGGFELALGCDARIAIDGTVMGLPEVTFGIIPGAGGTVRLPRLTAAPKALEIITSCRRVAAREALELGMIDVIVEDLRSGAAEHARSLLTKNRIRDLDVVAFSAEDFETAAATALRKRRGHPGVQDAIDALRRTISEPFDTALGKERDVFQRLRMSEESAALRHLFFAERRALDIPGLKDVQPLQVRKVGVAGSGTMGTGIAACLLAAGLDVVISDQNKDALSTASERVIALLPRDGKAEAVSHRLLINEDSAGFVGCDIVIEAIFEDMSAKTALLKQLDSLLPPEAIIASNTSYLDLDHLAAVTGRADRVVGLHFFSPAHVMKLLEVVRGRQTSDVVLKTALQLARRLGKIAVVSGVGEGFIGNRIYNAYRTACEIMLEEGCLPFEIDEALEQLGFAMGPFAVGDLSGLDIAAANRRRRRAAGLSPKREVPVLEQLVEQGRLGRKTRGGWYDYPEGARRGIRSPETDLLVIAASDARGISRREFGGDEIRLRALAAIVNEAALVLKEGIARRASDVDLVWTSGYGFPAWRGGPVHWAGKQDRAALEQAVDTLVSDPRDGFRKGDLKLIFADDKNT